MFISSPTSSNENNLSTVTRSHNNVYIQPNVLFYFFRLTIPLNEEAHKHKSLVCEFVAIGNNKFHPNKPFKERVKVFFQ